MGAKVPNVDFALEVPVSMTRAHRILVLVYAGAGMVSGWSACLCLRVSLLTYGQNDESSLSLSVSRTSDGELITDKLTWRDADWTPNE